MDPEEFRRLGHRAVDLVSDYLGGIRAGPVFRPMTPDARRALLEAPLPDGGLPPAAALDRVEQAVLPHPMGNGHPRFFGWVNAPPAPIAVLADLIAAAMNPSCAGGDHAAIYLERCAVRWLAELLGYPTEGGMGLLVSGGSMASLTCLAAARHRAVAASGGDVRAAGVPAGLRLVLYMSEAGHSCLRKSAELLGLGAGAIHTVPIDDAGRLDVAALRQSIAADRAAGRTPFCVCASAGTVSIGAIDPLDEIAAVCAEERLWFHIIGAIDPLDEIAAVCAEERLWFHIDGAYGAPGVLDAAAAPAFAGMARADSLAIDPHKWLSVPVECGCALLRDGRLLRETFSLVPAYQTEEGKGFGGLPWYAEYGFQQTRGFRALKLWMTLLHLGRRGAAAHVARHNALARRLAAAVDAAPDLERMAPVALSIVCFRYVPSGWAPADARLDDLNKAIMQAVQAGGEAFLTNADVRGRFALRACILHYGTTEDDIDALPAAVRRTGGRLAAGQRGPE